MEFIVSSTSKGPSTDLRNQSIYALWQAEHAMRLAIDERLRDLQISLPQFGTLTWLSQEPGLSTADLARMNRVSPQNMGMAVTRLLSLGYIERTPPRRGRVAELRLSEKGAEVLAAAVQQVALVQEQMLSGLSDAERAALPNILTRCRTALAPEPRGRMSSLNSQRAAADD
jgi:DNA-binding MarR family transcriptional regulator